jgi:hypothetical protein
VSSRRGGAEDGAARRFTDEQRGRRVLWGACDALFTPRAPSAARVAEETGGDPPSSSRRSAPDRTAASALLRELVRSAPTVLVLRSALGRRGDLTLRLLGRKVESAPVLVLATYRDDDLDLRRGCGLSGSWARRGDRSLRDPAATPDAVAQLAPSPTGSTPTSLPQDRGNAFFLSEVLAAAIEILPTVRDAVLAARRA